MKKLLVAICIISLQIGCTSSAEKRKVENEAKQKQRAIEKEHRIQERQAAINSWVGVTNFDGAIMAMGEPTSIFQGDDIFIATWRNQKSMFYPGSSSRYYSSASYTIIYITEYVLNYDKHTKMLLSGQYREWGKIVE